MIFAASNITRRLAGHRPHRPHLHTPSGAPTRSALILLELAALLPGCVTYLVLALRHLGLPGLYYDEAADAVPAMQLLLNQPVEVFRQASIELFGKTLPLMAFDYVGAVHTYAVLPFFALFGVGTVPLRLMTVCGGLLTLVATYAWLRWLVHSRWIGGAAVLLLATQPSFVFFTRQGVHVSSLMALWAMLSLLALLAWRRTGQWRWLGVAAFLLGVGLTTKILFLWFIVALVGVYALWQGMLLLQKRSMPERENSGLTKRTITLQAIGTLAAFVAGAWMLVLFNLQTGATIATLFSNAGVSQYGVANADYLPNLVARLDNLRSLLSGDSFWYLGGSFSNVWYPAAFGLGVLLLVIALADSPSLHHVAPGVFFVVLLALFIFLQSPFTLSGLWPTHLFILLPLLHAIMALGYYLAAQRVFGTTGIRIAGTMVLFLTMTNINVVLHYQDALVESGGRRGFSDAIGRLASYLDESGQPQPIAMDWGMKYNVQLLTQGRVNPLEVFGYAPGPDPSLSTFLAETFRSDPTRVYLFHGVDDYVIYPRFHIFEETARRTGMMLRLQTTIAERDGTPLYLVYSVN